MFACSLLLDLTTKNQGLNEANTIQKKMGLLQQFEQLKQKLGVLQQLLCENEPELAPMFKKPALFFQQGFPSRQGSCHSADFSWAQITYHLLKIFLMTWKT